MTATTQAIVATLRLRRETLSASLASETESSAFNCVSRFESVRTPSLSIACNICSGVLTFAPIAIIPHFCSINFKTGAPHGAPVSNSG